MTDKEVAEFNRGYLIACTNLQNMHDQPSMARDVLAELGISQSDVDAMDLAEIDVEALAEIRAEHPDPIAAK